MLFFLERSETILFERMPLFILFNINEMGKWNDDLYYAIDDMFNGIFLTYEDAFLAFIELYFSNGEFPLLNNYLIDNRCNIEKCNELLKESNWRIIDSNIIK